MDRCNFIKTATAAIAALALGVKSKAREIVTGVGRGSHGARYDMETWTYRTVYNQEPDEIEMLFQRKVSYSIIDEFTFSHPPEQWQGMKSVTISYDGSRNVECTIDSIENFPNGDMKVRLTPESRYLMIRPPFDTLE